MRPVQNCGGRSPIQVDLLTNMEPTKRMDVVSKLNHNHYDKSRKWPFNTEGLLHAWCPQPPRLYGFCGYVRLLPQFKGTYVGEVTLHASVRYNFAQMSWGLVQVGPCLQKMDGLPKREGEKLSHYCVYHLFRVQKVLFIEPNLICLH